MKSSQHNAQQPFSKCWFPSSFLCSTCEDSKIICTYLNDLHLTKHETESENSKVPSAQSHSNVTDQHRRKYFLKCPPLSKFLLWFQINGQVWKNKADEELGYSALRSENSRKNMKACFQILTELLETFDSTQFLCLVSSYGKGVFQYHRSLNFLGRQSDTECTVS